MSVHEYGDMDKENTEKSMEKHKNGDSSIAYRLMTAIDNSYKSEDHKIICPECGNEIIETINETQRIYACKTEGCLKWESWGL